MKKCLPLNRTDSSSSSSSSSSDSSQESSCSSNTLQPSSSPITISSPCSSTFASSSPTVSLSSSLSRPCSYNSCTGSSSESNHEIPTASTGSVSEDVEMLDDLLGIKKKVACDLCGKKVLHMKSHMNKVHGEGRPGCAVECGQCDRTVLLSEMSRHVLNYHLRLEKSPSPLSDEVPASQGSAKSPTVDLAKSSQSSIQEICSQEAFDYNFSETDTRQESEANDGIIEGHEENNSSKDQAQSTNLEEKKEKDDFISFLCDDNEDTDDGELYVKSSTEVGIYTNNDDQSLEKSNQENKGKVGIKSFLCDDSDDSNDSDISIVEIVPPVSMMMTDHNQNRVKVESRPENIKVKFLVKCKEKNPSGGKVKSMRLVMRQVKTVGQAKRRYGIKLVLDKNRLGDLQFMVEGRRLDDEDLVDQLDSKIVMAEGLGFLIL